MPWRALILAALLLINPIQAGVGAAVTESEARADVDAVNAELAAASQDYNRLSGEIAEIDVRIAAVEQELAQKTSEYETVSRALDARFKAIYKYSDFSAVEMVLASRDFNDFTERLALLSKLAYSDDRLMKAAADQKAQLTKTQDELAREKDNRLASLVDLGGQRREIESRLKDKETALSTAAAPASQDATPAAPAEPEAPSGGSLTGNSETGDASYYTWTGGYTAAHKILPFGTMVRVTNLSNGAQVWVEIVDRGPWGPGRIIDLEKKAFAKIANVSEGVVFVMIEW